MVFYEKLFVERDDFSFVFLAQLLATINTFVVRIVELNALIFFFFNVLET